MGGGSSVPLGTQDDEGVLGGQTSPLQLSALLQLFDPAHNNSSNLDPTYTKSPTGRGLPVSAASQEPHDLPRSLVLFLGQERPPVGQKLFNMQLTGA